MSETSCTSSCENRNLFAIYNVCEMKHDTLSYVKMFIFKVTKYILSNYHMHCYKKSLYHL